MLNFKWKPWFLSNTLYSHLEASIKLLFSPLEILQTCQLKNVLGLSLLVWSYGINISLQSVSLNTLNMIKFYLIFNFRKKKKVAKQLKAVSYTIQLNALSHGTTGPVDFWIIIIGSNLQQIFSYLSDAILVF